MELTDKNYYSQDANKEYMSYSQFKDFEKCPAMAMAKINGEWKEEETDSLLVGSYVDSWLDGDLETFMENHPQLFTAKGELKAPFKKAQEICEVISKDEYLYDLLKGQRQVIMTGYIAGVPFKIKVDSLHDDMIVDGKVLKDCNEVWKDGRYPFYMDNRYDLQAIIYKTIVRQNLNKELPFILGIVTKEKVPDKRLVKITDNVLEDAKNELIAQAPVYQKIKLGLEPAWNCGNCDYCKSIRALNEKSIEEM